MSFFCFVYVIDSGLHSFPTRRSSDLMMLLVQMFRMAWQPFFLRESDDPEAPRLYRDVFRYFNGIAGICFLVVALFAQDRKSTRLNSSHVALSYAVLCLKKKNRLI